MKRAMIIGCPGSGKSTFALALHERTGLPLYHLDLMYWNADKTTVSKEVFRERLGEVLTRDEWIIDGNYGSTMELRMQTCDSVFFLDYPTEVCLDGIAARRGKKRVDMPWVEAEGETDEVFLGFIRDYNRSSRPKVLALLERYRDKSIIVFRSRKESDEYLSALS